MLDLVVVGRVGFLDHLRGLRLPVFMGTSVGGVAPVAALSHAQVVGGRRTARVARHLSPTLPALACTTG